MKNRVSNKSVTLLLIVTVVYVFLCLTKHQPARLTADSMLYFSIAEKYVSGDIHNAVNGYWGPLLAWLLIPFIYFNINHILAINILDALIGCFTITGVWSLSCRVSIDNTIRALLLVSLLPIVLKFSLVQPMDFLLLCLLVYYLSTVFRDDYHITAVHGISSGILGSLAYFSKAYAFPFFIVHFISMNFFHYFRLRTKKDRLAVVRNAIMGLVVFCILSGSWILVISKKYGHITFSTMRDTNFNAPGPEAMGGGLEFGVPVFYEGFYPPPNDTAFVVWEDPSYLRGKPWSAFQSWSHFKHFVRLLLKNGSDGLKTLEAFSTLSITILIAYLLMLCIKPLNARLLQSDLLYPIFTLLLFSGGYSLFHIEERYLWLANVLLLIMGGHVLSQLLQMQFFKNTLRKYIILTFFIISFIFSPVKYIMQVARGGMDTDMYAMSTDLQSLGIKGNIASNREYVPVHDAWHKTFRLAYWLDSRYYGQAKTGTTDEELADDLTRYNIDYYFLWGEAAAVPEFISEYPELTSNTIPGLSIFQIKEKPHENGEEQVDE